MNLENRKPFMDLHVKQFQLLELYRDRDWYRYHRAALNFFILAKMNARFFKNMLDGCMFCINLLDRFKCYADEDEKIKGKRERKRYEEAADFLNLTLAKLGEMVFHVFFTMHESGFRLSKQEIMAVFSVNEADFDESLLLDEHYLSAILFKAGDKSLAYAVELGVVMTADRIELSDEELVDEELFLDEEEESAKLSHAPHIH